MKPVVEGQDHPLYFILITLIVSAIAFGITVICNSVLHSFSNEVGMILFIMLILTWSASIIMGLIISNLESKTKSKGNYIG